MSNIERPARFNYETLFPSIALRTSPPDLFSRSSASAAETPARTITIAFFTWPPASVSTRSASSYEIPVIVITTRFARSSSFRLFIFAESRGGHGVTLAERLEQKLVRRDGDLVALTVDFKLDHFLCHGR